MGPVLGPHARTDRTRNTQVAEPSLPAPEDGRPGEGQRLTPDGSHNGGRPPPPGTAPPPPPRHAAPTGHAGQEDSVGPPHPHTRAHSTWVADPNSPPSGRAVRGGTAPDLRRPSQWWKAPPPGTPFPHPHSEQRRPAGGHAVGPVLGPHARTDRIRDTRVTEPRLPAPEDGRPGEGQRLTPDPPHNGGRHPPRGRPSANPTGSNAGPQGRTLWGRCWVPRPHRPHPGHTGRRTPAARPRGRAAGKGTAPDPRRPSQRWQATPPGDGPPPAPRHAAPRGHAGQGDSVGPPHPHARDQSTWVADPNSPPSGRAVGGGGAPDHRRPSQRWKAAPRKRPSATPTASNAGPQGRMLWGRCWVPRPHRPHLGHTGRGTPATRPRGRAAGGGTAPDTRRPSQRWQATPPGDGPPPAPRRAAPTGHAGQGDSVGPPHSHTGAHSTWVADPKSPPSGRPVRGWTAPDLRRPSQRWKAPPPGMPFCHPHSEQRRPARAHAVGPVLGPHARTDRTQDTRVAERQLPAPEEGRQGEGQRLTPDAPHNGGRPSPPGTAPHHPRGTQPPQGMQAKGIVLGPHTHTPAPTACGWRTPTARPVGGQFREGEHLTTDAPHNGRRHPPGNALPPPPQRATPARKLARCGAGAGSPRPHRPHPGHTGRGTPATRS